MIDFEELCQCIENNALSGPDLRDYVQNYLASEVLDHLEDGRATALALDDAEDRMRLAGFLFGARRAQKALKVSRRGVKT